MKNQKELIISASAVELSHLDTSKPICVHIGENTLVAVPSTMTAMEAVNTINVLTGSGTRGVAAVLSGTTVSRDVAPSRV